MKRQMIQMIITDLDQTLLRDDGGVSDYTRRIWRECKRRGIVTGIATARLEANAVQIQEDLGADLLICSNGSKVIFRGERIQCDVMDEETVQGLTAALCALPSQTEILVETERGLFINTHRFAPSHPLGKAEFTDFSKGIRQRASQIYASIGQERQAQAVCERFAECRCLHYRDSVRYAFMAQQVSKERAIIQTAQRLGIPLSMTAAFGDDEGDRQMLSLCGLGVAVDNALPDVKEMADAVAKSNQEDGVAQFIEQKILH